MGKETVLFKSEEKMDVGQAADVLRKIADKLEKGVLVLSRGKEEVKLKVPGRVEVENQGTQYR